MKITKLYVQNYRTLESVVLDFSTSFAAICGRNDSGKTSVVRVIRSLLMEDERFSFWDQPDISLKNDYPKWRDDAEDDRKVDVSIELVVEKGRDAGLYEFIVTHLSLEGTSDPLSFSVRALFLPRKDDPSVEVEVQGTTFDGLKAQEVLKKLKSSRSVLYHNSTQSLPRMFGRSSWMVPHSSPDFGKLMEEMKERVNRGLKRIEKSHQREVELLLGRLESKYRVNLSIPKFDPTDLLYSITLGEKKFDVRLDDWGSGTQNRTTILLTLLRAKQISEAEATAGKVTPVIIVEEPESFLHPSAQAEFGRVLRDISEEFRVQVIVTTHSPYMLSRENATSNILLSRKVYYNQYRETIRVDTSGDNWMEPFGLALGLSSEEFSPWKDLFMNPGKEILLVEGDTDKEYLELLRDQSHGSSRLQFDGDIVAYDGTGNLKNTVLLRFIKNTYNRIFITYGLDQENEIEKVLKSLDFERARHYAPLGVDAPGRRCVEGLVPDSIKNAVRSRCPELVDAATTGTREEQQSAKNRLKRLYLEEFRHVAEAGTEHYKEFYSVAKVINRAFQ